MAVEKVWPKQNYTIDYLYSLVDTHNMRCYTINTYCTQPLYPGDV